MSEVTQGDWEATKSEWSEFFHDEWYVSAEGIDGMVAIVNGEANARLIAAKPETLEQRDELLEALVDLLNWVDPNENFVGLHMEVDMARAAIAKAKGEV